MSWIIWISFSFRLNGVKKAFENEVQHSGDSIIVCESEMEYVLKKPYIKERKEKKEWVKRRGYEGEYISMYADLRETLIKFRQ